MTPTVLRVLRRGDEVYKFTLRSLFPTALLTVCLLASADEPRKVPKIGALFGTNPSIAAPYDDSFRSGLRTFGYADGSNVTILARYAHGDATRYRALLQELIASDVDVLIVASMAVFAAKQATSTIPIVCPGFGTDPVAAGLATSLSRPGGNVTGPYPLQSEADAKRLQLAIELVPSLKRMGLLYEANLGLTADAEAVRVLAKKSGVALKTHEVRNLDEMRQAFSGMEKERLQALTVFTSPLTLLHRDRILSWSAGKLPVIADGDWAGAGAVISYSDDFFEMWRISAVYVDKILKGAKPGDLPIEQSTKFRLVVNLKAAKALGIRIPESILVRADEIIR